LILPCQTRLPLLTDLWTRHPTMRKLFIILIALLVAGCFGGFVYWAKQRPSAHYLSDLRSEVIGSTAVQLDQPNLLLIRPQLYPLDYQSPAHLRLKLAAALDEARAAGLLGQQTLVALPDHIGTWLLARDEKVEFYRAQTRKEVRDWLLLGNPLLAVRVLLTNLDAERLDEALLRMKATRMARDYQALFSGLASDFGVTLLAGSILLPEPSLSQGQLRCGDGALRNLSLVFGPDGQILGEPYSEPWPRLTSTGPQQLSFAGIRYQVERDWRPGYPQSRLRQVGSDQLSEPLFLRGKLSWPIGGAPREVDLTPHQIPQASEAPGSHVLNSWIHTQ
jgi:hypothetical protein